MDIIVLLVLGGFLPALVAILVVALYKPLLIVTPAAPEAVLRDVAYRLRVLRYAVDASRSPVKVPIGSVSAIKVHVRPGRRGTEVRYEVDATGFGWTLVIVLMVSGYLSLASLIVAIYIHASAASFARTRLLPTLENPPLGTLPPPGVHSFLVEGLSEAGRLVSEAHDLEREAQQNAIGLILIAAVLLLVASFFGLQAVLPPAPDRLLVNAVLATTVAVSAGTLGSWAVYVRSRTRIRELEAEKSLYAAALANEMFASSAPQTQQGGLELLLRAAVQSPRWREIRRRRRLWHDPIVGFTLFILGWGTFITYVLAWLSSFLAIEWRLGLGLFGSVCLVAMVWMIVSERREIREQDDREREGWERRQQEIETVFWKLLSG